jgi:DnaJ-class molecular chaperone
MGTQSKPDRCPKCRGSGRKKTNADGSYIRCSYCHGEGVEPADLWRWS